MLRGLGLRLEPPCPASPSTAGAASLEAQGGHPGDSTAPLLPSPGPLCVPVLSEQWFGVSPEGSPFSTGSRGAEPSAEAEADQAKWAGQPWTQHHPGWSQAFLPEEMLGLEGFPGLACR